MLLLTGCLVTIALASAITLFLRKFVDSRNLSLSDMQGFVWMYPQHPFNRLLDPADFAFLRTSGLSRRRLRVFRRARRRIFRYYLDDIVRDFNAVSHTLRYLQAHSSRDRPDLAALIAKEQTRFYRSLLQVHCCLVLHACGFDSISTREMVRALGSLQIELYRLVPVPAETMLAGAAKLLTPATSAIRYPTYAMR